MRLFLSRTGSIPARDARTMTDKHSLIQPDKGQQATAIHLVDKDGLDTFLKSLSAAQRAALAAQKFEADGYQSAIVPDGDHWFVVSGVANAASLSSWCMAKLAETLPAGTYRRADGEPGPAMHGWVTGQYRFGRYQSEDKSEGPRVLLTKEAKAIGPALAEARGRRHGPRSGQCARRRHGAGRTGGRGRSARQGA